MFSGTTPAKWETEIAIPIPTKIMVYGIFILKASRDARKIVPRNIGTRYSVLSTLPKPISAIFEFHTSKL